MTKQEHRVIVSGGKYTFVIPEDDYRVSILRHGEPWHGPQASAHNALSAIMCELDAARVVLHAARQCMETLGAACPVQICDALALHDRLTSDQETPSAWCGSSYAAPHSESAGSSS